MKRLMPLLLLVIVGNMFWLRKKGWKWFYQILATINPDDFNFMNYGYAGDTDLELEVAEEEELYSLQLYHHVAGAVDCSDCDVLEVGCGRGGGAAYISRYLKARRVVGVDLSENAVTLCNEHYATDGLEFRTGDAEALPFPEKSFDRVVNIESAFCYPHRDRFYREVYRVLRNGGYFLYADIEKTDRVHILDKWLEETGFTFVEKEIINENVIKACDTDAERRRMLIDNLYHGRLFRTAFYNFAAIPNSFIYKMIAGQKAHYLCYVLRKGE